MKRQKHWRQRYLRLLNEQPAIWIKRSLSSPSSDMLACKTYVTLHRLCLKLKRLSPALIVWMPLGMTSVTILPNPPAPAYEYPSGIPDPMGGAYTLSI